MIDNEAVVPRLSVAQDGVQLLPLLTKLMRAIAAPAAVAVLLLAASRAYDRTAIPATLWVNGEPQAVRTHATTVGALLEQQGLRLTPADVVWPAPETPLTPGSQIAVEQARPVTVRVRDRVLTIQTRAASPEDILAEAGIHLGPQDVVLVDGESVKPTVSAGLSGERVLSSRGAGRPANGSLVRSLEVRRAASITMSDSGVESAFFSTAPTVGEALLQAGLQVYLGDRVFPDLGTPLVPGMSVHIVRAVPVEIQVDSRVIRVRTQAGTVGEALAREGIALMSQDYSEPSPDTAVSDSMIIRVVRQRQEFAIEQEPIAYSTVWQPDPGMEIDQRRVLHPGEEGLTKRRIRVLIRDGAEVERQTLDEWVALEPKNQVFAYGTQVVIRELQTPHGTVQYWRKIRMLATSYTAATSGKARNHPQFGITRVGWIARTGIVAVDPTVVNLRTRVYVPGYGIGDVGDTGGAIKGRRIDLCYDEDELILWKKWVDIYLLAPAPPPDQIRYVIPDWPVEQSR